MNYMVTQYKDLSLKNLPLGKVLGEKMERRDQSIQRELLGYGRRYGIHVNNIKSLKKELQYKTTLNQILTPEQRKKMEALDNFAEKLSKTLFKNSSR